MNKILCIIQARMSSTRLPWKVMMNINDVPLLKYELNRVKKSKKIHKIVIATSNWKNDDTIESFCNDNNIDCFRWDLNNVLKRYYDCSIIYNDYDIIVRITGDCPLIDEKIIDETIELFEKSDVDYCSNCEFPTFPDWLDLEVFTKKSLEIAYKKAVLNSEKEHVTPYIRKHFKKISYCLEKEDYSDYRFTVDEQKDFELVKILINNVWSDKHFIEYIKYMKKNSVNINNDIMRNEWFIKSINEDKNLLNNW